MSQKNSETALHLQEAPIRGATKKLVSKQDLLNIRIYAEALSRFIHDTATPITIGLQGDWGSGKTSLMNLLRGSPEEGHFGYLHERHKTIHFNTWMYSMFGQKDGAGLALSCLEALTQLVQIELGVKEASGTQSAKDIDGESGKSKCQQACNTLGKMLSSVRLGVPGLTIQPFAHHGQTEKKGGVEPADNKIDIAVAASQFKTQLEQGIKEVLDDDEKLVFFIDDLDRLEPPRALEILEVIKNFMDIPKCVFILAIDYKVVQRGIEAKYGKEVSQSSAQSFFDKIIQLPFDMPTNNLQLTNYLRKLLDQSKLPHILLGNEKYLPRIVTITECTVGKNPRTIKRVMNYVRLISEVRKSFVKHKRVSGVKNRKKSEKIEGVDSVVLYALVCLHQKWPELFNALESKTGEDQIKMVKDLACGDKVVECLNKEVKGILPFVADAERLDSETTKNNIQKFMETLMMVLDEDGDGSTSDTEFKKIEQNLARIRFREAQE